MYENCFGGFTIEGRIDLSIQFVGNNRTEISVRYSESPVRFSTLGVFNRRLSEFSRGKSEILIELSPSDWRREGVYSTPRRPACPY